MLVKSKILGVIFLLVFSIACTPTNKKTQLTMYYPVAVGGQLTKVIDSMVQDFEEENPNIEVKAIYAGNYNDARIKSLSALKSGKPAQLAVMFSIDLYDLIEQDAIVSFSDVVKSQEDKKWLASFYPALMQNGTTLHKVWGIPFQRSTIVMYYNKDAFRKAGLNPDRPPATWQELVSMAKQLTTEKQWGIMIPSTGYPYWMFGALAKQNGEVLMDGDGKKTFFNKQEVIGSLDFWHDLANKYKVMPKGTIEWGTLRQNFLEGKTAIMWHSTGNLTAVKDAANFDFGVAMLPANKTPGSPTGGGNFYLFKNVSKKEQEAALKFVKFMTAPEQSATWSIATGYMGISPQAYETKILKSYVEKFPPARVARDQLEFATAELSTYQTGRIRKLLDDAIQSVLTNQVSAKEALDSAQKEATNLLKDYQ